MLASAALSVSARAATCGLDEHGRQLCCERWQALRYVNGRHDLGVVEAKSPEELQRILDNKRETHQALCRFGWTSDCHVRYGAPRCASDPQRRQLSVQESEAIIGAARMLAEHWENQLAEAALAFASASNRPEAGSVLAGYANALADAQQKLRDVQRILATVNNTAGADVIRGLEAMSRQLAEAGARLKRAHSALPAQAKDSLPAPDLPPKRPSSVAGKPSSQAVPRAPIPADSRSPGPGKSQQSHEHVGSPVAEPPAAPRGRTPAPTLPEMHPSPSAVVLACQDLSGCLDVPDAVWDTGSRNTGLGQFRMTIANTCSMAVRAALWVPYQGQYRPQYFQLAPRQKIRATALATKNEWNMVAAAAGAPDSCLKFP